ncbi:hypothetical protein QX776_16460 [Alteromonadaceae bacterium BrNp21-10]|nr:hypothetical protein [Alteromonadaceae bacterium BrNp21-10]
MIKLLNIQRLFLLMMVLTYLSACTLLNDVNPWARNNQVNSVAVYVAPNENLHHAISIDVLFIYSNEALAALTDVNSNQWFQQKSAFLAGYQASIDILQWQMVAGFSDESIALPTNHKKALAVIAYADHPQNPNGKVILTDFKTPWLIFSNGQLKVQLTPPVSMPADK